MKVQSIGEVFKNFVLFLPLMLSLVFSAEDAFSKDTVHDYSNLEISKKCSRKDDMGRVYNKVVPGSAECCLEQDDVYNEKCAPWLGRDRIDELFDKTDKVKVGKIGKNGYRACFNYNTGVACPEDSICFQDRNNGNKTTCAMRRKNVVSKDLIVKTIMSEAKNLTWDDISIETISSIKALTENFIASNTSEIFSISQIREVVKVAVREFLSFDESISDSSELTSNSSESTSDSFESAFSQSATSDPIDCNISKLNTSCGEEIPGCGYQYGIAGCRPCVDYEIGGLYNDEDVTDVYCQKNNTICAISIDEGKRYTTCGNRQVRVWRELKRLRASRNK